MKRTKQTTNSHSAASGKLNMAYTSQTLAGVQYQIYPCVLIVEGVHHGVGTNPVYYSSAVLEASAPHWNNMPVTVGHPVNQQGQHIMCNTDGTVRAQWEIGKVVNSRFEDGKLKAELWIDVVRANEKSPALLDFISNDGQLEVSTGLLAVDDSQEGQWNSEEYSASILQVYPDHLALLPNSTGACSWEDGCGVRWNAAKEFSPVVNEQELTSIVNKIRQYVDSLDVYNQATEEYQTINFARAIYSDYFVYEQRARNNGTQETKMYKQQYSMDNGSVVVDTEPVEVVEEITYKEQTNEKKIKNSKEENKMAGKKCCPKKVAELIANENNSFVADDQAWLEVMEESQLDKLVSNAEAVVEKVEKKEPIIVNEGTVTLESYLAAAPSEIRTVINAGLRELDKKRTTLIATITANEGNTFTEEQLKNMEPEMLEGVAALLPKPVAATYQGINPAATVINEGNDEEPYVPTTLSIGTKKE